MSLARVKAWQQRFREGRVSLADDARSGTPHPITDDIVQLVNGLVTQDRQESRIERRKFSYHHDGRTGLAQSVRPMGAPHLQPQQEACRMVHCIDHLQRYARQRNEFLARVVAGDESWCHHFELESKRQSLQWKHPVSPPPKNPRPSTQVQERLC